MAPRTLILLFLSLALAAAAGYSNWRFLIAAAENEPQSAEPSPLQKVVVARADLRISQPMNSLMLDVVDWPARLAPKGTFERVADVIERIPRRHFAPGEPLLESGLFGKGALAGLSPLIENGRRAMSVKVDEVIGIAGFVSVGARVDVLATLRRTVESEAFSQVILQDVRILAVDRALEPRETDSDDRVSVVTLEVSPEQAKKLAFASSQGSIQLALRSPGDTDLAPTGSVGTPNLKGEEAPKRKRSHEVTVLRGLERSSQKFLGGELVPSPANLSTAGLSPYDFLGIPPSALTNSQRRDN
ncbi:MAG: Flp pilus assembly protein CpaB [Myxococcota bacterium]|nr:Flp pilus assembly protein CpaB [Myxococcota bacterium]